MKAFFDVAEKWSSTFVCVHYNALAFKHKDHWWLYYAKVFFRNQMPPTYDPLKLETDSVRAVRIIQSVTPSEAVNIVAEFRSCPTRFIVDGWEFRMLRDLIPENRSSLNHYELSENLVQSPSLPGPLRIPTLEIVSDVSLNLNLQEIDLELGRCDTPYENLAELMNDLHLGVKAPPPLAAPRLEICLFPPLDLQPEQSSLDNGTLSIVFRGHRSICGEKLKLAAKSIGSATAPLKRFPFDASKVNWTDEDESKRGEFITDVGDAKHVQINVSYDGEFIARWWLNDKKSTLNSRLDLHRAAFPGFDLAATFFENRDEFENKICLALTLLGLTCLHYGEISKLKDMCDLLVVSKSNHVFLVECTTGGINSKGKLLKLKERCAALTANIQQLPIKPISINPIVFTALAREETAADWREAQQYGISIWGRQDIATILTALPACPSDQEIQQAVTALIPNVEIHTASTSVDRGRP